MHKVQNFGSALQAYALRRYISRLRHNAELIDYIFPNGSRKQRLTLKQWLLYSVKKMVLGRWLAERRFKDFYKKHFVCTKEQFDSPEALMLTKFDYDLLLTGSDQVWNPHHVKDDYSFFLPFAPEGTKKASYASSFSQASIPEDVKPVFKRFLNDYSAISVREKSGIDIVKDLTGRDAEMVCDPTLLLAKEDWEKVIKNHTRLIRRQYILAYILTYAYDPYPEIDKIIDKVQQTLGLHVVKIGGRLRVKDFTRKNSTLIETAGPLEFLNLVRNASFIITTSFHGTAFALNFGIPFYSVVNGKTGYDTRVMDLLEKTGHEGNAVVYNQPFADMKPVSVYPERLDNFRLESQEYLNRILSNQ